LTEENKSIKEHSTNLKKELDILRENLEELRKHERYSEEECEARFSSIED
jgi:hypothetical protein